MNNTSWRWPHILFLTACALCAGYFAGASVAMHVWQPQALVRFQAQSDYLYKQVQALNYATGRTPQGLQEGMQWTPEERKKMGK